MPNNRKTQKKVVDTYNIVKFFCLWAAFAVISFGVKAAVMKGISLSPTGEVGNGILTLYRVENTGAAFNMFSGQTAAIIAAGVIALVVLTLVVLMFSAKLPQSSIPALSFLSAGITMNTIERLCDGYVTDYIHCNFLQNFPVFNVPDIMIVIGAICLALAVITRR